MHLSSYAEHAVALVNTDQPVSGTDALRTPDDVRALVGPGRQITAQVTEADVTRLRSVRARLRMVFTHAQAGHDADAVAVLNGLLAEFPPHPRVSSHDGSPWHLHLADGTMGVTQGFAAVAATGLAVQLTTLGVDRLGVCASGSCHNVFVDASPNRSRRYCGERCATRAGVARHRARQRAQQRVGDQPER